MNIASLIDPSVGLNDLNAVTDMLNRHSGSETVNWQFLVCDRDRNPVYLTSPPNPAVPNDLAGEANGGYVIACTIDLKADADVTRQATFSFAEVPGFQFNWARHRINVRCGLKTKTGQYKYFSLGWYGQFLPDRNLNDAMNIDSGSFFGLTGSVTRKPFIHEYATPPNTRGTDIIRALTMGDSRPPSQGGRAATGGAWPWGYAGLTPAGCTAVLANWPAQYLNIAESDLILDVPKVWSDETRVLAALKDVTQTILFNPGVEDANGIWNFQPNPFQYLDANGSPIIPGPDFVYQYGRDSIINGSVSVTEPNMAEMVNMVAVKVSNNGKESFYAEAWNNSLDSLVSIPNQGDTFPLVIKDDTIPTPYVAQQRAVIELVAGATTQQQIVIPSMIVPLELYDFVGINVNAKDGTPEISVSINPYQVRGISIDTANREMQVTAGRLIAP